MVGTDKYAEYSTFNSNVKTLVLFDSVSHIIANQIEADKQIISQGNSTWIHFHNGKCIHVTENYNEVCTDLKDYYDNL